MANAEALQRAFDLIEENFARADFEGPKSEELVSLAEATLNLKFPPTYRDFLRRFGCGDISGQEFYGVIHENFETSGVPDAIWLTLNERRSSSLPNHLVIVFATGDGGYYTLDTSERNDDGECPVVAWEPGRSTSGDNLPRIADDFGRFLLETIERSLT